MSGIYDLYYCQIMNRQSNRCFFALWILLWNERLGNTILTSPSYYLIQHLIFASGHICREYLNGIGHNETNISNLILVIFLLFFHSVGKHHQVVLCSVHGKYVKEGVVWNRKPFKWGKISVETKENRSELT